MKLGLNTAKSFLRTMEKTISRRGDVTGSRDSKFFIEKDFTHYSGKWVAIRNQKIIASHVNIDKTLTIARKKVGQAQLFIAKIPQKNQILIL